jgi:hypothetical protein
MAMQNLKQNKQTTTKMHMLKNGWACIPWAPFSPTFLFHVGPQPTWQCCLHLGWVFPTQFIDPHAHLLWKPPQPPSVMCYTGFVGIDQFSQDDNQDYPHKDNGSWSHMWSHLLPHRGKLTAVGVSEPKAEKSGKERKLHLKRHLDSPTWLFWSPFSPLAFPFQLSLSSLLFSDMVPAAASWPRGPSGATNINVHLLRSE